MAAGGRADPVVEGADPRGERAGERRDPCEVREGHRGDAGALGGERTEHRLEVAGDLVGVEPRPQYVVDPGDHGGQVRAQGEGRCELLGADLPGEAAADGQVGVPQTGTVEREVLGQAVGQPAQAGHVVAVADALGLAVAQGDVAQVLLLSARHGPPPLPQDRDRTRAPVAVAALEGEAAQAGQIGADTVAAAQEVLLGAVAAHRAQQTGEQVDLGLGEGGALGELRDERRGVDVVGGLDLDDQVVADGGGLGGGGGELLQLGEAGAGDGEQALVGPGVLDHFPARDQPVLLQPGQLRVELLRERVPEVGHTEVERLGQLVPAQLLVQQCRQYGVAQSHRIASFSPCFLWPLSMDTLRMILKKLTNHIDE